MSNRQQTALDELLEMRRQGFSWVFLKDYFNTPIKDLKMYVEWALSEEAGHNFDIEKEEKRKR